jgi:hypothetical protein
MLRRLSTSIKNRRKAGKENQKEAATESVKVPSTSNGTNLAAHGNVPPPSTSDTNGATTAKRGRQQSWRMSRSKSVAIPEAGIAEDGGPVKEDYAKDDDDGNVFEQFASVLHASRRPLPIQTGDGTYIEKETSTGIMDDLKHLGFKDYKTLMEVIQQKANNSLVDDKTYLMERVIQLVSGLPSHSQKRAELTNAFLDQLWNTLQHPPLSYFGNQFNYRSGDGRYIKCDAFAREQSANVL